MLCRGGASRSQLCGAGMSGFRWTWSPVPWVCHLGVCKRRLVGSGVSFLWPQK